MLGVVAVVALAVVIGVVGFSGVFGAKPAPRPGRPRLDRRPWQSAFRRTGHWAGGGVPGRRLGAVVALNTSLRRPHDARGSAAICGLRRRSTVLLPDRLATGAVIHSLSTTEIQISRWLVDGNAIWVTATSDRSSTGSTSSRAARRFVPPERGPDGRAERRRHRQGRRVAWVALFDSSASSVVRVDPATGSIVATVKDVYATELAATDNRIWASAPWGAVVPIDPTTMPPDPDRDAGPIQSLIAVGDGPGQRTRKRACSTRPQPGKDIPVPHFGFPGASSIAAGDGTDLGGGWRAAPRPFDIASTSRRPIRSATPYRMWSRIGAHRGAVVEGSGTRWRRCPDRPARRIARQPVPCPRSGGPRRTESARTRRDHQATCAKLLDYPDKPAPEGSALKPEVAIDAERLGRWPDLHLPGQARLRLLPASTRRSRPRPSGRRSSARWTQDWDPTPRAWISSTTSSARASSMPGLRPA